MRNKNTTEREQFGMLKRQIKKIISQVACQ